MATFQDFKLQEYCNQVIKELGFKKPTPIQEKVIPLVLKNRDIKVITKYLIDNIYVNGAAFTGIEVLEKLGRSNLSVVPLINYFYKKYGNGNY